jgi:hypothetical protein
VSFFCSKEENKDSPAQNTFVCIMCVFSQKGICERGHFGKLTTHQENFFGGGGFPDCLQRYLTIFSILWESCHKLLLSTATKNLWTMAQKRKNHALARK